MYSFVKISRSFIYGSTISIMILLSQIHSIKTTEDCTQKTDIHLITLEAFFIKEIDTSINTNEEYSQRTLKIVNLYTLFYVNYSSFDKIGYAIFYCIFLSLMVS